MKLCEKDLLLYLVTDRAWLGVNSLAQQVEDSIEGGATFIQLREKCATEEEFLLLAQEIKLVTDACNIPFVINDDIDMMLKVNADGVHIGQNDLDARKARQIIGTEKILGVSVRTVAQAIKAEQDGADYLGVGAVFSTSTKLDEDNVSIDTLKKVCQSVKIPVVAIGGIHENNIRLLAGSGICGVAVVSAVLAKENVKQASTELKNICNEIFE